MSLDPSKTDYVIVEGWHVARIVPPLRAEILLADGSWQESDDVESIMRNGVEVSEAVAWKFFHEHQGTYAPS